MALVKNQLARASTGLGVKIRPANFYSESILPKIAKRFSGLPGKLLLLFLLLLLATPSQADPETDLAVAKKSFDRVQQTIIARTKAIDPELRGAAWGQYYLALDRLRRMDVHYQMMTRHQQDRSADFNKSLGEFRGALEQLEEILSSR